MRETQDGFLLAEEDLRLRGGGELLGTRNRAIRRSASPISSRSPRCCPSPTMTRVLMERDGGLVGARGDAARAALSVRARLGRAILRGG
jgi:ATP-dependent DNA helicase RecG